MRELSTPACALAVSLLVTLAPAYGFGKKKSTAPAAQTQSNTSDVVPSIDDVLKTPVKPAPLRGNVETIDGAEQNAGKPLEGKADSEGDARLKGAATDEGAVGGKPLQPKADTTTILKGNAVVSGGKLGATEDPDLADRELMVEWDRWRNKFLRAVQLQVQAGVNHPDEWEEDSHPKVVIDPYTGTRMIQPRFPMGTEAWFTCEITADKRVKNLSIVRPSGHPGYDKAVLEGVRALEGTSLLNYPAGSHRTIVSQTAGIRTATSSDYQYHHFGDVERVKGQ